MQPVIVTIAGSDSSGGAGIQADLKAIVANGGYPATVLTAVTAQSTTEVRSVDEVSAEVIEDQIDALFDDLAVAAVKTGMLPSGPIVERVAGRLRAARPATLVCDPVMIATSGSSLQSSDAREALVARLLPLATLVTPNAHEARELSGVEIGSVDHAEEAGRRILDLGARAVLVKGGHLPGRRATDVLVTAGSVRHFDGPRVDTRHTHGSGCVYASAIATHLAHGASLEEAVQRSKEFVTLAIEAGLAVGRGPGPVDPFFFLGPRESIPWRAATPGTGRGEP